MKVKDFAEKYNMPYHIVYDSTWLVDKNSGMDDETELKEAVKEFLKQRIERYSATLQKAKDILAKLEP